MGSPEEELARIDQLLAEATQQGAALARELGASVEEAALAVGREYGGRAESNASFAEPFRRAGPLLAGAAAARRVPELFVADETDEQLLVGGGDDRRLGERWLRLSAGGGDAPESERASVIAELRQRLERLEPGAYARRDTLLPLLAPLVPLPELWRICVAWRASALGVLQLSEATARPSAVAESFEAYAGAALQALKHDLGVLRSFAASPAAAQPREGRRVGALGLSGAQLADELVGTHVVEAFGVALDALRTAASSAKVQEDLEGGITAAEAAVRCYAVLFDVASRGGTILRTAGLAADDADTGLHGDATAGQLTQTPRESLVPVPTPSSVKTPSAITFRELGPPENQARGRAADMPMSARATANGVIWPTNWLRQRDAHAAWVSGALQWALSPRASGQAGATAILRLCRVVSGMLHMRLGVPWMPPVVRETFATGAADWLAATFSANDEPSVHSWPQEPGANGSEKLAELACGCTIAATLTGDSSRDGPLLARLRKQYTVETARLASEYTNALRTTVLADLDNGQHWRSHRPFLPNRTDEAEARCSYALQMWRFSLTAAEYDLSQAGVGTFGDAASSKDLRLFSIVQDVMAPLLVQTLEAIVNRYVRLTFTRARVFQLQTDVFSVATVVWDFRQRLFVSYQEGASGAGGQLVNLRTELDELCGLLLRSAAVLTAPLQIVLDWLDQYVANRGENPDRQSLAAVGDSVAESPWADLPWLGQVSFPIRSTAPERSEFDPVLEMGKLTACGDPGEAWNLVSQPWFHNREQSIPWATLLHVSSPSLDLQALLDLLRRRTELRDGDYPALSEAEEALAARLREAMQALAKLAGGAGDAVPEPEPPKFVKAFSDDDY
jgi:hypothetical protein